MLIRIVGRKKITKQKANKQKFKYVSIQKFSFVKTKLNFHHPSNLEKNDFFGGFQFKLGKTRGLKRFSKKINVY